MQIRWKKEIQQGSSFKSLLGLVRYTLWQLRGVLHRETSFANSRGNYWEITEDFFGLEAFLEVYNAST